MLYSSRMDEDKRNILNLEGSKTRFEDVTPWEYEIPGISSTGAASDKERRNFVRRLVVWKNGHFDEIIARDRIRYNLWRKKNGFSRPIHGRYSTYYTYLYYARQIKL